jgi:hypothetical protein
MRSRLVYAGLATFVLAAACQQSTAPATHGQLKMAFSTRPAPTAAGSAGVTSSIVMGSDTMVTATDTLVIDTVQIVLRKVELERVDGSVCDTVVSHEGDDGCEEVEAGPVLVNLPIGDTAGATFSVSIPVGSYEKIDFQVHAPTGDTRDQAFLAANPQFAGTSIRVVGTFNGKAFTFTSALTAEQELELSPPLTVADTAAVALTIRTDVSKWFANGTALIDPSTALVGGVNEGLVENNIRASFRGFHDQNDDGLDDNGEEGGTGGGH